MTNKSDTEVVHGYISWRHIPAGSPESAGLAWAPETLQKIITADGERGLTLILAILAKDDSAPVADGLSAGPLEDLLTLHGEGLIDKIEDEARRDPRFSFLLWGVWQNAIPPLVWRRIDAIRERRGRDGIPI